MIARLFCLVTLLTLTATTTQAKSAIPEKTIQQAVDRSVASLKKLQKPNGQFGSYGSGSTALVALALLECGVSPDDECIRKAVAAVRTDCPALNRVYNLSLALMLFDRLGDPKNVPLIHALSIRLLEGQFREGGWSYTTPAVGESEVQRLKVYVQDQTEMKSAPGAKPGDIIDADLQDRLNRIAPKAGENRGRIDNQPAKREGYIDNSNTQFAVLALWVARRHHIPSDDALKQAERYFRSTHENGTWYYVRFLDTEASVPLNIQMQAPSGRAAMTCAGLLGIAVGSGVSRDAVLRTTPEPSAKAPALPEPTKDRLVTVALIFVAEQLAESAKSVLSSPPIATNDYYFLWSLERMAVAYSLATVGPLDWYQIGATMILRHQDPQTGLWTGKHSSEIDSAFALLFLRRANFARDLTINLSSRGRGGQSTLTAGDSKDKPASAPSREAVEAERLSRELKTAPKDRLTTILNQLRDGKGSEYTDALVKAIPELSGDTQRLTRDALAERLAGMTIDTIRGRMRDENPEMRRAAALACAVKDAKVLVPDLIATLEDRDNWVVRAATAALRALTSQDFGPSANATSEERKKAIAAWKDWWQRHGG